MRRKLNFLLFIMVISLILGSSYHSNSRADENMTERGLSNDESKAELIDIAFRSLNDYIFISSACGHYQTAYGSLPDKLEDLMNGFMLLWPKCTFKNEPIKVINQMPDPNNPDHVGKVYYEKIDNFHGNIYYLQMNIEAFEQGQSSWVTVKQEIELPVKRFNSDGTLTDSTVLSNMNPEDRMWFGYRRCLYPMFSMVIYRSLERDGNLENSFSDFLVNNGCYVFRDGIEMLKNGINNNKVAFDIGDAGDGMHFYYDLETLDLNTSQSQHFQKCVKAILNDEPLPNHIYVLQTLVDCPPVGTNTKSFFNSGDFNTYSFPDELLINKEDLI